MIAKAGMKNPDVVRWSSDGAGQQMCDLLLQDPVGWHADCVGVAFGFQELVDLGLGEGGIRPDVTAQRPIPIAGDHRLENQPPILGAVDIAGTREAALQVAKMVEAKEPVMACVLAAP